MILTIPIVLLMGSVIPTLSHYTNEWAVQVRNGDEHLADQLAQELNCINKGRIFEDTFLFEHKHVSKRSVDAADSEHLAVQTHPKVVWAEQQKVLSRQKRQLWRFPQPQVIDTTPAHYVDKAGLNDQRWPQMWYLNRGGHLDMNVQDAWLEGATGKGVSITILDDGIERSHPDLVANYDPLASFDVNDEDNDPSPRYDLVDSNRHGTRCAGEVAATANNSECAVGVAFESGIGGVRMLDGDVTDAVEARSLGLNNQHVSIYSASWGPDDDGKTVDGPGRLASRAFLRGIQGGRGGKGSIFVWASGNGGRDHDNCNCDGYTNSIWTLSVSSATENGLIPWYSEPCSSTLASTYSSGSSGERKVVTTDLHHTCTSSHTGTSASAPMAAGIIALTLQINPELNWRDVQHITIRCSHVANLKAADWAVNSLGRNFSHSFGYGIMDAACMVRMAKQWKSVPEQKKCSVSGDRVDIIVPARGMSKATIEVKSCEDVKYLEHVQAHVTLGAAKRGDVLLYLTSPSGTKSNLLAKRPRDYNRMGFNDWPFLTVHMWEESPVGTWTLEIHNEGRSIVQLKEWRLAFLGTESHPQPNAIDIPAPGQDKPDEKVKPEIPEKPSGEGIVPPPKIPAKVEHCEEELTLGWCNKCEVGFVLHVGRCVDSCPAEGFFKESTKKGDVCVHCYYSCKTCSGPNDYQCLTCYGDAYLNEESSTRKFCHNKSLIAKVFSSSRWYYVLSLGFLVNFCIVVILVSYILRWRRSSKEQAPILPRKLSVPRKMSSGTSRYSPVKPSSNNHRGSSKFRDDVTLPFKDYESSSEDEQLVRKPFRDDDEDEDELSSRK